VTDGAANAYYDEFEEFGDAEDDIGRLSDAETSDGGGPDPIGNRAVEGAADFRLAFTSWFKDWTTGAARQEADSMGIGNGPGKVLNTFARWLRPHIHDDFIAIRKNLMTLPESLPESSELSSRDHRHAYLPPEMWAPRPVLWIPQDEARVSRQEVAHTIKYTPIHDTGARLDESGRVIIDNVENAPMMVPRVLL
jgi:calcium permeable stress-gated cation channel